MYIPVTCFADDLADTKAVEHEHQPAPPSRMNKKQIVKKDGRMANWPGVYVHKKWDDSDSVKYMNVLDLSIVSQYTSF